MYQGTLLASAALFSFASSNSLFSLASSVQRSYKRSNKLTDCWQNSYFILTQLTVSRVRVSSTGTL